LASKLGTKILVVFGVKKKEVGLQDWKEWEERVRWEKSILVFDGEENAYWWLIYIEKHFNAVETSEEHLGAAVKVVIRWAFIWSQRWSLGNPVSTWLKVQIALLWQFKLLYRDVTNNQRRWITTIV